MPRQEIEHWFPNSRGCSTVITLKGLLALQLNKIYESEFTVKFLKSCSGKFSSIYVSACTKQTPFYHGVKFVWCLFQKQRAANFHLESPNQLCKQLNLVSVGTWQPLWNDPTKNLSNTTKRKAKNSLAELVTAHAQKTISTGKSTRIYF